LPSRSVDEGWSAATLWSVIPSEVEESLDISVGSFSPVN
jgi:hypothetical protein